MSLGIMFVLLSLIKPIIVVITVPESDFFIQNHFEFSQSFVVLVKSWFTVDKGYKHVHGMTHRVKQ